MNIYVYKEYCDSDAYGEELIRVFSIKENAERYLKMRVESYFELPWDKIQKKAGFIEDDTLEKDYVSYGNDGTCFWVIEKCQVDEGLAELTRCIKEIRA